MKLLTFLASTALLVLAPTALAAPVDTTTTTTSDDGDSSGLDTAAVSTAANYGSPQCKTAMMTDLCISDNAKAYCDVTGFHNEFMKSCEGNCFCA